MFVVSGSGVLRDAVAVYVSAAVLVAVFAAVLVSVVSRTHHSVLMPIWFLTLTLLVGEQKAY